MRPVARPTAPAGERPARRTRPTVSSGQSCVAGTGTRGCSTRGPCRLLTVRLSDCLPARLPLVYIEWFRTSSPETPCPRIFRTSSFENARAMGFLPPRWSVAIIGCDTPLGTLVPRDARAVRMRRQWLGTRRGSTEGSLGVNISSLVGGAAAIFRFVGGARGSPSPRPATQGAVAALGTSRMTSATRKTSWKPGSARLAIASPPRVTL